VIGALLHDLGGKDAAAEIEDQRQQQEHHKGDEGKLDQDLPVSAAARASELSGATDAALH
jgi:hypothetical protein